MSRLQVVPAVWSSPKTVTRSWRYPQPAVHGQGVLLGFELALQNEYLGAAAVYRVCCFAGLGLLDNLDAFMLGLVQ